jgi:hypothetical protein
MKLAEKMRQLTNKVAYAEDSEYIKNAYSIISSRIEVAAKNGKSSLIYPFDGISSNGLVGALTCTRLDDEQIKTLVRMFEKEGFKYHYQPSQDPGHPCDRELHEFTW